VTKTIKKRLLKPALAEECGTLKAIWLLKKKGLALTLQSIADISGITPGAVAHYLNGKNPLNTNMAAVFAQALEIRVFEFSPRLDTEIRANSARAGQSDDDELTAVTASINDPKLRQQIADYVHQRLTAGPPINDELTAIAASMIDPKLRQQVADYARLRLKNWR